MFQEDVFPNFYQAARIARRCGRSLWPLLRWGGRLFRALLPGLAFAVVATFVIANLSAEHALEAELRRVRAAGEPLSLREAAPPPVPESENAAPLYERAFQSLPRLENTPAAEGPLARRLAHEDDQVIRRFVSQYERQWRTVSLRQVRQALAGTDAALALARQAAAMPRCRFPVNWEAPSGAMFPHVPRLWMLSQLLAAHAVVAATDRDPSQAVADLTAILGIARHLRGEPILVSQLVGYGRLATAASTERRLLEIAPPGEAECRRLDQAWSEIDLYDPFQRSLETERCFGLWAFNLIATHPDKLSALIETDDPLLLLPRRLGPLGQLLRKRDEIEYLRRMREEIDWEKEREQPVTSDPYQEEDLSPATPVTRCLLPAFYGARRQRGITAAQIALARWGLAIAVYRQRTGHLPETLRDVEETAGWRLPADPFTGADLRYRRTAGGYLLYSLGPNREDDNGQNRSDKAHATAHSVPPSADDVAWWFGT